MLYTEIELDSLGDDGCYATLHHQLCGAVVRPAARARLPAGQVRLVRSH